MKSNEYEWDVNNSHVFHVFYTDVISKCDRDITSAKKFASFISK